MSQLLMSMKLSAVPIKNGIFCRFLENWQIMPYIFRRQGSGDANGQGLRKLKVMLYAEDHNPPHVHVIGTNFQAKVRIRDAVVFVGTIPSRHRREALAWIAANHDWLMAKWNELS